MKRLMMSLVLSAFIVFTSVNLVKAEENNECLNNSHMTLLSDHQLKASVAQGIDGKPISSYKIGSKNVISAKIILWDELGKKVSANVNINTTDQINYSVARH